MEPYPGRRSRLTSCPPITEQGVRPQVDDVLCLHHTADRSGTGVHGTGMEACLVSGRDDQNCQGVTLARHGHSVGYVTTHVSPSLYPGFHYIRSTKGSSYEDDD